MKKLSQSEVKDFGGEKGFLDVQKRGEVKNKWCSENNVRN
jgi:hypothetical protein